MSSLLFRFRIFRVEMEFASMEFWLKMGRSIYEKNGVLNIVFLSQLT